MPNDWGIRPVLFYIGSIPIKSYQFFMSLALIIGFLIYKYQMRKEKKKNIYGAYIVLSALFFGSIGVKLPLILFYWKEIQNHQVNIILSGRTIIGGLIGGFIGTVFAKKIFKIKEKHGNYLAIPIAVGMAIGRVGCLCRGCCYGKPTHLSWGIDFGDHISRHPTQIYEIIFDLGLAVFLLYLKKRKKEKLIPGELFKIFLTSYLTFRFIIEFIRTEKMSFILFTDFQWLCIISILFINKNFFIKNLKNIRRRSYE